MIWVFRAVATLGALVFATGAILSALTERWLSAAGSTAVTVVFIALAHASVRVTFTDGSHWSSGA